MDVARLGDESFAYFAMNKQRKTIIVLLGVAMLALVIDRVFMDGESGPRTAAANTSVPQVTIDATTSTTPKVSEDDANFVLARRLEQLQQSQQFNLTAVPNAFEPSTSWIQPKVEIVQHTKPKTQGSSFDLSEQFVKEHHLIAVLGTGEGGTAIVNGKRWTVGNAVKGWTLTNITIRTAVFEKDGKQAVLQIAAP